MERTLQPLNALCRAYIYAIHCYFLEILFTVIILDQDWTFHGLTSLGSLFTYGTCGLALEQIHLALRGDCCLLTRCTLYTLCIFLWQFSTGYVLQIFNACPWDYSQFRYSFMGLIALEHTLIWFVSALLLERLVIRNTLRLRLEEPWKAKERLMPKFELKDD
ncbi:hypothetical protein JD844_006019 [Phrynosoma platyrhinos]|uniref:Transmembrane protein 229B n=1 Tax=Phrynosoma platyrhinos TaxID=52577 RepID=A0ABQ7TQ71_PHRPL|nr:hypothetical protein JD844_006019 [Phrynosoma platyrhinos]